MSHSTVFAIIIKRLKLCGTVEKALKSGAPLKLTPVNQRFIMHKNQEKSKASRAVKLRTELEKKFTLKVSLKLLDKLSDLHGYSL